MSVQCACLAQCNSDPRIEPRAWKPAANHATQLESCGQLLRGEANEEETIQPAPRAVGCITDSHRRAQNPSWACDSPRRQPKSRRPTHSCSVSHRQVLVSRASAQNVPVLASASSAALPYPQGTSDNVGSLLRFGSLQTSRRIHKDGKNQVNEALSHGSAFLGVGPNPAARRLPSQMT